MAAFTHTDRAARINEQADDPSVGVHVPYAIAAVTINLAGGGRGFGRTPWEFADGFSTLETDEALRYALYVLAEDGPRC